MGICCQRHETFHSEIQSHNKANTEGHNKQKGNQQVNLMSQHPNNPATQQPNAKIIEVHNLSKRYRIYKRRSASIKEMVIRDWFRSEVKEEIWALKDVSFSITGGVALGIIGANGSGKSTLLKIISGITMPTSGEVTVRGKVASLLDLGMGFHPELTGMENIYLNGSLLGLTKNKIDAVLDTIISFAGLDKFIYMPVKHYSSGMLMRLSFSIAAHVDPDILVLDEVLGVGDTDFQQKSARKILDFKRRGKTIILVTHNLEQAEQICDRVLWLDSGRVKIFGDLDDVISGYLREFYDQRLKESPLPFNKEFSTWSPSCRLGSGEVLINKVVVTDGLGHEVRTVYTGETLLIDIHYTATHPGMDLEAVIGIGRLDDVSVTLVDSTSSNLLLRNAPRKGVIKATFSPLLINEGRYRLSLALNPPGKPEEPYDMHLRFYEFKIASKKPRSLNSAITHPVAFENRR